MSEFKLRLIVMALLLTLIVSGVTYHTSAYGIYEASSIKPVRSVVWDPLPSKPLTATLGSTMSIEVVADSSASDWSVQLSSKYGDFSLELVDAVYSEETGRWTLTLKLPSNIPTGLYSLKLSFTSEEEGAVEYTQPRCVNVTVSYPKELLIAHLSDIHLPYGADVLARAVYELNLLRPSLVVITGDLVDVDTISSAWKYAWSILIDGPLEVPAYILPGNHDHSGDDAANYMEFCGPLYWYVQIGDFHLIALDTALDGYVDMDQLAWAESILGEIGDGTKILMFHHPLFSRGSYTLTGSWEEVEQFSEYLYYSWNEHIENAKELLRLVEQYNISLIMSGHIHTEHYVVYNDKHYFEVNLPAGGGLREGDYWSYRLVRIDENGNVQVICLRGKYPYMHPSSYPIGHLTYYYTPSNDGSASAVSIVIINDLNADIEPFIEFAVKADRPADEYSFYPESPEHYEVIEFNGVYYFRFRVKVPAKTSYYLTLAATSDNNPPTLDFEYQLIDNTTLSISTLVSDYEWGVKSAVLMYSINGATDWIEVPMEPTIEVNKDGIKAIYSQLTYNQLIDLPENAFNVSIRIVAEDFAGNQNEVEQVVVIREAPPSSSEQPVQQTPEQPPEQTEQPEQPVTGLPMNQVLAVSIIIVIIIVATVLLKIKKSQ